MTALEKINEYDKMRRNQIDFKIKLNWIKELEEIVISDVVESHDNMGIDTEGYFDNWNENSELLIPHQFQDIYFNYLDMKQAFIQNEMTKYNSYLETYNNAYITYQQWVNRHYKPKKVKPYWLDHRRL